MVQKLLAVLRKQVKKKTKVVHSQGGTNYGDLREARHPKTDSLLRRVVKSTFNVNLHVKVLLWPEPFRGKGCSNVMFSSLSS